MSRNPVALEDALPARDRQRVERADRSAGVLLEVVKVRGLVALAHSLEDCQVQLHELFDVVEHAAQVLDVG
jgi:hypothetical protein